MSESIMLYNINFSDSDLEDTVVTRTYPYISSHGKVSNLNANESTTLYYKNDNKDFNKK